MIDIVEMRVMSPNVTRYKVAPNVCLCLLQTCDHVLFGGFQTAFPESVVIPITMFVSIDLLGLDRHNNPTSVNQVNDQTSISVSLK